MVVAVASGKGGTGKTTVATALAATAPGGAVLLDCDVEAPNCSIYLPARFGSDEPVTVPTACVDPARCRVCGACADACQFSALAAVGGTIMAFPELCHGCGACALVCPHGAMGEQDHPVGALRSGDHGSIRLVEGRLAVGSPMAVPVIRAVRQTVPADADMVVIDCPPGTSCPMVTAADGADLLLLVAEPTPFGLHDLKLALEAAEAMGLAVAVVINRCPACPTPLAETCSQLGIPVVLRIPESKAIAAGGAHGRGLLEAAPQLEEAFRNLWTMLIARYGSEASVCVR